MRNFIPLCFAFALIFMNVSAPGVKREEGVMVCQSGLTAKFQDFGNPDEPWKPVPKEPEPSLVRKFFRDREHVNIFDLSQKEREISSLRKRKKLARRP